MKRLSARALACALALSATFATVPPSAADATVGPPEQAAADVQGGRIPSHFVGLSIEWSLVERYMNPSARPAFVNLLRNLRTGVLRIGGSSQDQMPFDATAPNTNRVITPEDLAYIHGTLDEAGDADDRGKPRWGAVLGTAMSPPGDTKPWVGPQHAKAFVTQGVEPAFPGQAAKQIAGIELGNEPDLSYGSNLDRYLGDLATYADPAVTGPFPVIAPNTSEDILPWTTLADPTAPTRYFHDWPRILNTGAPYMRPRAGEFGAYASDHFYPLARTCVNKPYRCAGTTTLLSDEHLASLDYEVYTHATEAARHRLGYRLEETSTAANRGADGVSNVAASATYALSAMFHTACPQPRTGPAPTRPAPPALRDSTSTTPRSVHSSHPRRATRTTTRSTTTPPRPWAPRPPPRSTTRCSCSPASPRTPTACARRTSPRTPSANRRLGRSRRRAVSTASSSSTRPTARRPSPCLFRGRRPSTA